MKKKRCLTYRSSGPLQGRELCSYSLTNIAAAAQLGRYTTIRKEVKTMFTKVDFKTQRKEERDIYESTFINLNLHFSCTDHLWMSES